MTGANTGIGKEVARGLVREGAKVVLACRDADKAAAAAAELAAMPGADEVETAVLDVASTASVRAFAKSFRSSGRELLLLVNNAGIMGQLPELSMPFAKNTFPYHFDAEAYERMREYDPALCTNYLGPFLLTYELLLSPGAAEYCHPRARVVNVASDAHYRGEVRFEGGRLVTTQQWSGQLGKFKDDWYAAYARSKLCQMLSTVVFNQKMVEAGRSCCALAVSPGRTRTELMRHVDDHRSGILGALAPFAKSFQPVEKGAETVVWACVGAELCADGPEMTHYLENMDEGWAAEEAGDLEVGQKLWDWSCKLMGINFEFAATESGDAGLRDPRTGLFFDPSAPRGEAAAAEYVPIDWAAMNDDSQEDGVIDASVR